MLMCLVLLVRRSTDCQVHHVRNTRCYRSFGFRALGFAGLGFRAKTCSINIHTATSQNCGGGSGCKIFGFACELIYLCNCHFLGLAINTIEKALNPTNRKPQTISLKVSQTPRPSEIVQRHYGGTLVQKIASIHGSSLLVGGD